MGDWFETRDIKDVPRDLLETFYHNQNLIIEDLHSKIERLSGCREFGSCDGMNGCCVDCSYDNEELWNKCAEFSHNYEIDK